MKTIKEIFERYKLRRKSYWDYLADPYALEDFRLEMGEYILEAFKKSNYLTFDQDEKHT